MKKISQIIDGELIARVNNVKLRQEFGTVGTSSNLSEIGNSTLFTTEYNISQIIYVTLNGLNLIENKHYFKSSSNVISISNEGSPIRNNTGLTYNLLVAYHHNGTKAFSVGGVRLDAVVDTFYINKYSGKTNKLLFDFIVTPKDATNISWSILKDGDERPLYTGSVLSTTGGKIVNAGNTIELSYTIDAEEYALRQGDSIPFTFVLVYSIEKNGALSTRSIIKSVSYLVDVDVTISGTLDVSPKNISSVGLKTITGSYNIKGSDEATSQFVWKITKSIDSGVEQLVLSGNQDSNLIGTFSDTKTVSDLESSTIRYYFSIKEAGSTVYRNLASDSVVVAIEAVTAKARAGYLDAAIMSYVDPVDNIRKTIGSLGTIQDRIEYNARVPRAIFTTEISDSYLTSNKFISAPVNTFANTVSAVYFVIEVPDSWPAFSFNQALGTLGMSAFNKIVLGNGYTAYIYKDAPSNASNPSDYFLKKII